MLQRNFTRLTVFMTTTYLMMECEGLKHKRKQFPNKMEFLTIQLFSLPYKEWFATQNKYINKLD